MELAEVKKHYYLALVPEPPLRDAIEAFKTEIKHRFGAIHAQKSPAHITLQMPFHMLESEEPQLMKCLREFACGEASMKVGLHGFDCFPPRVLFVKILDHRPLQELQARLKLCLFSQLGFHETPAKKSFHPHMTIANRDLRESDFESAWSDFKERSFQATFRADRLYLLKHNGKFWDLYREFPFQSTPGT
jgi:2'-5' RNA ligase